jgi:predicted nuclease of predicted toxin-antitoxin system
MILWLDAQLPPAIAGWIKSTFAVDAISVRELGFRDATDIDIFQAARSASAVVMTKDLDFVSLVERLGAPPQILWVTCGNTSNSKLREILQRGFSTALLLVERGEPLVEITDSL